MEDQSNSIFTPSSISEATAQRQLANRGNLVPAGFECVAHPVFFRSEADPSLQQLDQARLKRRTRRRETATALLEATKYQGAADVTALTREVDSVCPICLGRYERPVTITSCLHSFCHSCILGWYGHIVAVALARSRQEGEYASAAPAHRGKPAGHVVYRCPLCQTSGPYFLSVDAVVPTSGGSGRVGQRQGENTLRFKLLGARTILGGGGAASGGVQVDDVNSEILDDDAIPEVAEYPGMDQLRLAVRTHLALASAVSSADKAVSDAKQKRDCTRYSDVIDQKGRSSSSDPEDKDAYRRRCGPALTQSGESRNTVGRGGVRRRKRPRPNRHRDRKTTRGLDVADTDRIFTGERRRHREYSESRGFDRSEERASCGERRESSSRRSRSELNVGQGDSAMWDPGAKSAEEGLRDIERMIEREKRRLDGVNTSVADLRGSSPHRATSDRQR